MKNLILIILMSLPIAQAKVVSRTEIARPCGHCCKCYPDGSEDCSACPSTLRQTKETEKCNNGKPPPCKLDVKF